ncbi:MAG TPA: hypothetical protein VN680_06345 [Burkholderiaceae bacterium]|nr:hypothetical protein [Burkholderiaceae bacterium]
MATAQQEAAGVSWSVKDWVSFDDAYAEFSSKHPMLGLPAGEWGPLNLRRTLGTQLVERGVAVKLPSRKWIAHRARFGPVLFELLTAEPARIVEQARARQAGGHAGGQP